MLSSSAALPAGQGRALCWLLAGQLDAVCSKCEADLLLDPEALESNRKIINYTGAKATIQGAKVTITIIIEVKVTRGQISLYSACDMHLTFGGPGSPLAYGGGGGGGHKVVLASSRYRFPRR